MFLENLSFRRLIVVCVVLILCNFEGVSPSYSLERVKAEDLIKNISYEVNNVISSGLDEETVIVQF